MNKFYNKLLSWLKPLIVFMGKLHLPYTRKKITGKFYYRIRDEITLGTVLLATTHGEFSNLINPTEIKHGAIYLGKFSDGICYVSEALGGGVIKTDLVTFLTTKDVVVGIKPNFLTKENLLELPFEATKFLGMPYDYYFENGAKALYCFENIIEVFKALRPELNYKQKEIIKGRHIYDPDTFLKDKELFTVQFDSRMMEL